ncbi:hypothetical protein L596_007371 [Steinernema carpocapsae]|uniref:Non-structural maintenance of chromosomes element 1 homolog n=1 Tax=Steinernema carpocapsae TaxID=34508 RepID=A0A4U5P931_STECR|nr:hypothetical protein L596_007371 [Steinernema carpocapsae]
MESTIDQLMAIARGDYGDYHKLLAQTLLKEAVFENLKISDFFFEILKLFEPEFRHVHLSRRERETLQEVLIHKMNDELSYVFFHIVRVTDEYEEDHRSYYAMISDMPFNESFAANVGGFTKQQMGLFDMWLQLMYVTSSNKDGRIEVDQALNAIDMMQYTMPKKQIQDVIHKMISEKWLIDEEGMLRLHPRALAELRQVLKSEPFLVPVCATCQNLISNLPTGIKCSCGRIVHKHCFETVQGAGSGTDFRCDCGNVLQSSQNAEVQESSESGGSAQENDED